MATGRGRPRRVAALGLSVGAAAVALGSPARAGEPSPWSDSERLGELVYFGLYGGVSFASTGTLEHTSSENGSVSVLDNLVAPPSWTVAYDMAWWPYDFFGLDVAFEGFGLPYDAEQERFDRCVGSGCRLERTPAYDGFGMQVGPTVRGAVPLRYAQPNVGVGIVLPVTFLFTQDPVSRLDETAFDVGAALRLVGGISFFVARDWRLYADYHLDYRFAAVAPGTPLETGAWMRHSLVLGLAVSPDGYQESPSGDKVLDVVVPFALPLSGWLAAAIIKGASDG